MADKKKQFKAKPQKKYAKSKKKNNTHHKNQSGGETLIKESDQSRTFLNSLKMTNTKDSKEFEKKAEGTPYYPGPMPIPDCVIM